MAENKDVLNLEDIKCRFSSQRSKGFSESITKLQRFFESEDYRTLLSGDTASGEKCFEALTRMVGCGYLKLERDADRNFIFKVRKEWD